MIVVDASVLVVALADDGAHGEAFRSALSGHALAAPDLIYLEVMSVLRRQVAKGTVSEARAGQAVGDLVDLPIRRAAHRDLAPRCWELKANFTPYDAAYVALAEALAVPLVTSDQRLAGAPGKKCDVRLLLSRP